MKSTVKKSLIVVLATLLLCGCVVGGTVAWLMDQTAPIQNTFTIGNVDIDLTETDADNDGNTAANAYKMVPGATIAKDPTVTVKAGSEACWVFIKVEKSAVLDQYITYALADGWHALSGVDGVYYREQADNSASGAADVKISVLKDDQVTVKSDVTKPMMEALQAEGAVQPTLTFTAYAIQKSGFGTASAAWAEFGVATN